MKKEINYDSEIIKTKIEQVINNIDKYIKLRNEIKSDLNANLISEEEYWEYSTEYSKKVNELKKEKDKLEIKLTEIGVGVEKDNKWIEKLKNIKEVKELNRLLIDDLIEDIVIDKEM